MITELSPLKYTEKCLKYIYEFSRTTNKTGATIFTYKIHKANTPYAGLEGCKVGLSLILLSIETMYMVQSIYLSCKQILCSGNRERAEIERARG